MPLPLRYSVENVAARPVRSLLTASVIGLVVVACSMLLALISSLKHTLISSAHPLNIVVLRKGADNDGSSQIPLEAYRTIRFLDGIARDAAGETLVSPELVVQPFFRTRAGGRENLLVRGVVPMALEVHESVRVAEGRMFAPSAGEAVIGRGVAGRYVGAALGEELQFGRGRWKVVGILDAGGSSFESEVWVDVGELGDDAKRPLPYSAIRLRAASPADIEPLVRRLEGDPRFALAAQREAEYYAKQSEVANPLYVVVIGIAVLAGLGATFGAANTMYAAVQSRTAEIGTLRALGFSRAAILTAFELEAATLAGLGFVMGALCTLALSGLLRRTLGSVAFGAATFTTNIVTLQVGAADLVGALVMAAIIGLGAGIGPASRAAHLRPVEALRRA